MHTAQRNNQESELQIPGCSSFLRILLFTLLKKQNKMEEYVTKLTKLSRSCFNESRNSKTTQPRIKNSSFYTIVLYYSDVKYQVKNGQIISLFKTRRKVNEVSVNWLIIS